MALAVLSFVVVAPVQSALADNDVGCGVGTQIWEGQKGLPPKIMASLTNGITFQSISITFGLLNCNGRDTVTADAELRKFASTNVDRLALDAARGQGASLDALASLYGIEAADRGAFNALAQRHFETLFPNDRSTAGSMLEALNGLMSEDPVLAGYAKS